jgi:ABC-type microcin C transport system duplicated ATPase subunit YejF
MVDLWATSRIAWASAYLFISHDLNLVRSLSHRLP